MKRIELVNGIQSSVLGFGCAPILGSVGNGKAKRAIDCALDFGINHFDLARSYGYGEAEAFVGKQLRKQRDKVIFASKFGIKANFKAKLLSPVKPLIRYAMSFKKKPEKVLHPTSNQPEAVPTVADRFHYRIDLTAVEMRKSLEQSLSALKTDYLDYFFVHEPLTTLLRIDELAEEASRLKNEGKIRAWGLAYMQSQKHMHTAYLDRFDVLQFNNSPGIVNYESVVEDRASKSNIFFSPINGGQSGATPTEKLLTLHADFPSSVILCSMFNEQHLKSNASLFEA
jgi:aryl-alcohol dehydrogenase-like predicted oxidoreductase